MKNINFEQPFSILGFNAILPSEQDSENPYFYLERQNVKYKIKMVKSNSGTARRIINFLKQFKKYTNEILEQKESLYTEKEEHIRIINKHTIYKSQIDSLKSEIENLKTKIMLNSRIE